MTDRPVRAALVAAGATAAVSVGLTVIGRLAGLDLMTFVGVMTGASTFVPLPADAYVVEAGRTGLDPLTVGVVGGVVNGAVVAWPERAFFLGVGDHPRFARVRALFGTNRWLDVLDRAMFLSLVVSAFSFLPFEPFRLVASLRRYPIGRYFLAAALGRGFRYYWLARAGEALGDVSWGRWVVWALVAVFVVGLISTARRLRSTSDPTPTPDLGDPGPRKHGRG